MAPQSTQSMDTTFQTSLCRVIPYTEIDGIPTFKDSDVKGFYDRIAKDGLVEFIFHDGYIQTSDDFLMMMKGAGAALYVAYYENDPVGVGWLTHFEAKSRSCRAHFTTFSEVWNKDTVSIGREVFNQMLHMTVPGTDEYVFDVFLGLVPSVNVRAVKWLNKVGLVTVGEIPNALWDEKAQQSIPCTLFYLIR